jgi:dTDP-4-amino-4,6-dideoxygalactose transaminase
MTSPSSSGRALPPIPFARPSIGAEEEAGVLAVLRSGWLTTGPVAARFEQAFARAVGMPHALALNSATAGLHLALEALGTGPGSLVITTPYTFTATAEVARYLGADPRFVDVEERTANLDPARLDAALDAAAREARRVAAVVPVHVGGRSCDMEAIMAAAGRRGVPVVEDCAHAFPVVHRGRMLGTWGEAGVYSFYATKTITTGEGGMVVTRREDIARRIRVMRLHGIDRDVWNRYTAANAAWEYDVVEAGYKYNLTDLAAAIGVAQLAKAETFLHLRRRVARTYLAGLDGCGFLDLPEDTDDNGWHLFVVRLRPDHLAIGRDQFVAELQRRGIGTSVHFIPLHLMSYYRARYGLRPEDFPVALRLYRAAISLPIFPSLTDEEIARVVAAVREVGEKFRRAGRRTEPRTATG